MNPDGSTTVFEIESPARASVWRTGNCYGTFNAGHVLAVELAKELENLRKLNAALAERCAGQSELLRKRAETGGAM